MARRVMRWVGIGVAFVALVAVALALRTLYAAGELTPMEPVGDLACTKLGGVPGAEHLLIDRRTDTAYVSSTDRRAIRAGRADRGDLFAFDLSNAEATLRNLTADLVDDFRPLGLSLHVDSEGTTTLMAVNDATGGRKRVEVFRVGAEDPFVLSHVRTVEHERIVSPNDLAAVGPDAFYLTNDHTTRPSWWREVKDYLLWTHSDVLFWDGDRMRVVDEGLRYANGIALSHDGRTVYVAETIGRALRTYARDADTGQLTLRHRIPCGTGVDNIDVDEAGNLWIGAHPKMLRFVAHAEDPSKRSPSQVLHVDVQVDPPEVETVWLSMGEDLSGSSVAAVRGDKMLIGSVFEPHILICDWP
jgi:arylesterase / paraoxonase